MQFEIRKVAGAIRSLFFAPRTDYVMHLRADYRRRTTTSAVTFTVKKTGISF